MVAMFASFSFYEPYEKKTMPCKTVKINIGRKSVPIKGPGLLNKPILIITIG